MTDHPITPFVHLHVHSHYSFLDSTLSPEDVVRLAAAAGATAVALTDTNCMAGVVAFAKAAMAAGIRPILGAEVRARLGEAWTPPEPQLFAAEGRPQPAVRRPARDARRAAARPCGASAPPPPPDAEPSTSPTLCPGDPERRMVVLARNLAGYSAISHMVTRRMVDDGFNLLAEARALGPDVVVLTDCVELLEALAGGGAPACALFGMLRPSCRARALNRAVYDCCTRHGVELAVACDACLATPDDAPLHDLLQAMRRLTTLDRLPAADRVDPARHFMDADAVCAALRLDAPARDNGTRALRDALREAVANTARIAAMCDCRLPLGEWKFPRFAGLRGGAHRMLRELVERGVRRRYGSPPPPAALERMERELAVIRRLDFSDYFLLVNRIVDEARHRGLRTVGRGSGANSIVSYVLGLTDVCPIRHNLYFERFLNPERAVPPDVDIDFPWRDRDAVIAWCFDYFGRDHVALVSTVQTLRSRQALREVARAHGVDDGRVRAFNRLRATGHLVEEQTPSGPRVRDVAAEEPWRTLLPLAERVTGLPHHFSIHCGGVIIAPFPVADLVPLAPSAKGFVITQMDMHGVEEMGLLKMDLLGNRSLGVLADALEMAGREDHENEQPAKPPPRGDAAPEDGCDAGVFRREAGRIRLAGTRRGTSVALAGVMEAARGTVAAAVAEDDAEEDTDDDGEPPAPGDGGASGHRSPCASLLRQRVEDFEWVTADPATRALIDAGLTMGCFYIESPGMRALFERLHCRDFGEVVAASSIIRPGVAESGMMREYIERHTRLRGAADADDADAPHRDARAPRGGNGRGAPATAPHPLMLRMLPETHGVMVYQEDVLRVAHELAGMSFAEADLLRRAMSGKMRSRDAMAPLHERFIGGAVERGVSPGDAAEIWRQVASFAGYSFCKGHSAAFAVLSYQTAYLKAHYPAEFFAAVLNNRGGFYGPAAYLEEARRWGVRVLPPCVNAGGGGCTGHSLTPGWSEPDALARVLRRAPLPAAAPRRAGASAPHWRRLLHPPDPDGPWLRIGLDRVAGLRPATLERILATRGRAGVFASPEEFVRRTGAAPDECRALVLAGALDALAGGDEAPPAAACATGAETPERWAERTGRLRGRLMARLEEMLRPRPSVAGANLLDLPFAGEEGAEPWGAPPPPAAQDAPPATLAGVARGEAEALGFMLSAHPLDLVRVGGPVVAACDIRRHARRRARMVGWMISAKMLETRNGGGTMKMLSMEDRTGTYEAVLFPRVHERLGHRTLTCGPYLLEGRVDDALGSPTLNVDRLRVLRMEH